MEKEEPPKPPPIVPPTSLPPPGSSGTMSDAMVPTNNPSSLISYYTGLFAIIPIVGLLIGPIALYTGRNALMAEKANPQIKGKTHAKVGIGCGALGLLFNLLIFAFIFLVMSK